MTKIEPIGKLYGEITVPGDKSISHRAVMVGAITKGTTRIKGIQDSDDCNYTIKAFQDMGIDIRKEGEYLIVEGRGLKGLKKPANSVYAGSSGTTMRVLAGILAGQDFEATITGDAQLLKRPMKRVAEPLLKMGVDVKLSGGEYPPIVIKGGVVKAIDYRMQVPSAQVKSAVLFAGLFAPGITTVEEKFKSRDHTERMLKYFGAKVKFDGLKVSVAGGLELKGKSLDVPGDISSASFFLAGAALLKGSKIKINNLGINPTRSGILEVLKRMGAGIKILNKKDEFEPVGDVVMEMLPLKGIVIGEDEIPSMIDELPVIFVLAACAKGKTVIKDAKELRVKETDRIRSMSENLSAMGAKIEVSGDNITIEGVRELRGARLKSFGDHRTCMAMTIAALAAGGESEIDAVACVSKSFPEFFEVLEQLKG